LTFKIVCFTYEGIVVVIHNKGGLQIINNKKAGPFLTLPIDRVSNLIDWSNPQFMYSAYIPILLLTSANPTRPKPRSSMVDGSGAVTGPPGVPKNWTSSTKIHLPSTGVRVI
jgi:hypothetical protein